MSSSPRKSMAANAMKQNGRGSSTTTEVLTTTTPHTVKSKISSGGTAPLIKRKGKREEDSQHDDASPLEQRLFDAGPVRDDGSDKFWGLENFGNTCYCNSIIQCLYYSKSFRENVIKYPRQTSAHAIINDASGRERLHINTTSLAPDHPSLTYPRLMARSPNTTSNNTNSGDSNTASTSIVARIEDKDNPEFKKKLASARGPRISMDYDNTMAYDMTESLFTGLKDMFEALCAHRSRVGVMSPTRFLETLRRNNEMFRSAMHQDAHEFLNLLLNDVVESVESHSRKSQETSTDTAASIDRPKSLPAKIQVADSRQSTAAELQREDQSRWVHQLFEGLLTSETKCLTCENVSRRDEVFLDLSVDLQDNSSVTSCLRNFSREEMLRERNKFHCDNCNGLQEAERRMKIKRLPKILALHLKRFRYTEDLQRLQKLFHRVVYPFHLRLCNTTDDADDPERLYELYAVVVHSGGGPYYGHYVAVIKTEDRGWLLFDDEHVQPVDQSYVQNFFGGPTSLACAYVLFYQETTEDAVRSEQDQVGQAGMSEDCLPDQSSTCASTLSCPNVSKVGDVQSRDIPKTSLTQDHDSILGKDVVLQHPKCDQDKISSTSKDVDRISAVASASSSLAKPSAGKGSDPGTRLTALDTSIAKTKTKKEIQREEKERRATVKQEIKAEVAAERARRKLEWSSPRPSEVERPFVMSNDVQIKAADVSLVRSNSTRIASTNPNVAKDTIDAMPKSDNDRISHDEADAANYRQDGPNAGSSATEAGTRTSSKTRFLRNKASNLRLSPRKSIPALPVTASSSTSMPKMPTAPLSPSPSSKVSSPSAISTSSKGLKSKSTPQPQTQSLAIESRVFNQISSPEGFKSSGQTEKTLKTSAINASSGSSSSPLASSSASSTSSTPTMTSYSSPQEPRDISHCADHDAHKSIMNREGPTSAPRNYTRPNAKNGMIPSTTSNDDPFQDMAGSRIMSSSASTPNMPCSITSHPLTTHSIRPAADTAQESTVLTPPPDPSRSASIRGRLSALRKKTSMMRL